MAEDSPEDEPRGGDRRAVGAEDEAPESAVPGSDGSEPTADGAGGEDDGEPDVARDGKRADDGSDTDPVPDPERAVRSAREAASAVERAAAALDGMGVDEAREDAVPEDVRKYERFTKMDGAQYERVNEFLRERTYITAREWAIARLCADFRTETGVEMTKIGDHLPELVPFMTDTYTPQAVNQARASFEEKVRTAGATFLYGAMCDFFTAEELDDIMYEVTEVAKFLLEVEGVDLSVDDELAAEDRISGVMRDVRQASEALRYEECPNCGHDLRG